MLELEQAYSLLLHALPPDRLGFELRPVEVPFVEHLHHKVVPFRLVNSHCETSVKQASGSAKLTEGRIVQQSSCCVLSLANTDIKWYQNRSITAEKSSSVRYSSLQVGSIPFSMRRSANNQQCQLRSLAVNSQSSTFTVQPLCLIAMLMQQALLCS
jgi:hypothetical protein